VGDGLMGFGATILFINLFSGFISKKKICSVVPVDGSLYVASEFVQSFRDKTRPSSPNSRFAVGIVLFCQANLKP